METLKFDVPMGELSAFRADAILGKTMFQVVADTTSLRAVRAALIEIARFAKEDPERRAILVMDAPRITDERLHAEWRAVEAVILPGVFERLMLVIEREGGRQNTIGVLSAIEEKCIPAVVEHERRHSSRTGRRSSEVYFDILRILINQWIKGAGPLTSRSLAETAGCTYPTVAVALGTLEKYLIRHSDRSVELKAFPKDEWFRLVANADKVRETIRFADHSGQPRSVESLISRLQRLQKHDPDADGESRGKLSREIAIGGVPGARRFFPMLDLVGIPRLDLTIHSASRGANLDFIRQLDPALKPGKGNEPARVVVHILRQAQVFFETDSVGTLWADPVECLLDLHEMRFESQVLELIETLPIGMRGVR